jgi:hypothetical protein
MIDSCLVQYKLTQDVPLAASLHLTPHTYTITRIHIKQVPDMAEEGSFKLEFGQPWTEAETQLLQQQILEAFPCGLYKGEPPMLWERIVQRMAKAQISPKCYLADECRRHYFTNIEPRIRSLYRPWEVFDRPWSERESDTFRTFIHHTLPGGLYKTGLMIWNEIGQRMTQAALDLWLPFRMYEDNCLREHYFRHVRPRFVDAGGARIPVAVLAANSFFDPPWSDVEHDLLRLNTHFTLPGGLLNASIILWPEISRNMMRDAPQVGSPYRLYTEDNVRAQYFKYIRPRYVPPSTVASSKVDMTDENTPRASDTYMKDENTPRASNTYMNDDNTPRDNEMYMKDESPPRDSGMYMKDEETPRVKYRY